MVRTNYVPHCFGGYAAHAVKKAVRHTPVFTVHRILTPDEAEAILERHEADGVTLVRALIADPEWVNKARDGRADEIRHCTGINQSCYGNLLQSMPINCVQNPWWAARMSWASARCMPRHARSGSWSSAAGPPVSRRPGWRRRAAIG